MTILKKSIVGTLALFNFFATVAHGAIDPVAESCIQRFLATYDKVNEYSTVMTKKEFGDKGRILHDELVELVVRRPNYISFKYLNEGSTGIRNNGMLLEYTGSPTLKIKFGEAKGLGHLLKGPAEAVTNGKVSMFDEKVLEDEIFTINRAGFETLWRIFRQNLSSIKASTTGGVKTVDSMPNCVLRYSTHSDKTAEVRLKPTDSIFDIEEKFGSFAYMIFHENRFDLARPYNLYNRKSDITVRIPAYFLDFEVAFDESHLPKRFVIFKNEEKLAEYGFKNTKIIR